MSIGFFKHPFFSSRAVYRILAFVFFSGLVLGWYGRLSYFHFFLKSKRLDQRACQVQPVRQPGYTYINPLLLCEVAGTPAFASYRTYQSAIEKYIDAHVHSNTLIAASVYFRDFRAGQWVSIHENEHYAPASLLKVPIMIATLKYAESHPDFLAKRLYHGSILNPYVPHFLPSHPLELYRWYSIDELLHAMIAYSDNEALVMVYNAMDPEYLGEIYTDLGLTPPPDPGLPGKIDFINTKTYAYFFRILYNSTYLSRVMSEKTINLLLESDFSDGILPGIPSDVKIAHKFGERVTLTTSPPVTELHECGIVYMPDHPYLLCVMTKGWDFDSLTGVLRDISVMTYAEMFKKYGTSMNAPQKATLP